MPLPLQLEKLHQQTSSQLSKSFDEYLLDAPIVEPRLLQAIKYALLNGGKRMRPLLVNLVGDMLGVEHNDLKHIALAVECIHAYSLVHDDLPAMDDDDLRRGNPTCHIKYDEATAILAGDALQCAAFEILATAAFSEGSDQQRVALIAALSKAAGGAGMVAGQSIDLLSTNKTISLDELRTLHSLKTGALLSVCVLLPCIVSQDVKSTEQHALMNFSQHIGMAFQIQDDILDVTADTQTLGKPQGSDSDANKSTFVSLLGLEGAKQALTQHHQQALQALGNLPYNTKDLIAFTDFLVARSY